MGNLSYKSYIIKHKCTNTKRQTKCHMLTHHGLSLLNRRTPYQLKVVNEMILDLGFPIIIKERFTLSICQLHRNLVSPKLL